MLQTDAIAQYALQKAVGFQRQGEVGASKALYWFRIANCADPSDARIPPLLLPSEGVARTVAARRAMTLDPSSPPLWELLAPCEPEFAFEHYRRALILQPAGSLPALLALAERLLKQGRARQAYPLAWLAETLTPGNVGVLVLLASSAAATARHSISARAYEAAARLSPQTAQLWSAAASAFKLAGRTEGGLASAKRSLALNPGDKNAVMSVLHALESLEDAIWPCVASALFSSDFEMWHRLSEVWLERGENERAWACAQKALLLKPDHKFAFEVAAKATVTLARFGIAEPLTRTGLTLFSDSQELAYFRSLVEMAVGDLARGWDLQAERTGWARFHRFRGLPDRVSRTAPLPEKLFVAAEQGLGDELLFLSCLPDLLREVSTPTIEVDARLIPLFQRSFPTACFRDRHAAFDSADELFDYSHIFKQGEFEGAIFTGDLACRYRRSRSVDEARRGYLRVDPVRRAFWRDWIDGQLSANDMAVGIAWSSHVKHATRRLYNADLEAFGPLLISKNKRFFSLQYHDCSDEIADFETMTGIEILQPPGLDQRNNLDDTAAYISALNFVVSADTSPCLIAAAVGCPTIRLSCGVFRVFEDRDLWFANMRPMIRKAETTNVSVAVSRAVDFIESRTRGTQLDLW